MGGEVGSQNIHQDIDQLEIWGEMRLMSFNQKKCELLDFGRSNVGGKYTVNCRIL